MDMTDSSVVLYIAATAVAAQDGATALEDASHESSVLDVEPVTCLETVRKRAANVDCVVFAETPTTAAGSQLLEVIDVCPQTPLVLFTDTVYGPTAASATAGIDGYVRRDGDAFGHLADEVTWVIQDDESRTETQARSRSYSQTPAHSPAPLEATSGADTARTRTRAGTDIAATPTTLLESLPDGVFTVNRAHRLTYANEWVGDLLAVDADAVRDVPLDALATGRTLSDSDVGLLEAAVESVFDDDENENERPIEVELTVRNGETETPVTLRVTASGPEAVVTVRPTETASNGTANVDTAVVASQNDAEHTDRPTRPNPDHSTTHEGHTARDRRTLERARLARDDRLDAVASLVDEELQPLVNVARGYLEIVTETGDDDSVSEVETAHERIASLLEQIHRLTHYGEEIETIEPVAVHDSARQAWANVDGVTDCVFDGDGTDDERAGGEKPSQENHLTLDLGPDRILVADRGRLIDLLEVLLETVVESAEQSATETTVEIGATDDGFVVASPCLTDDIDPIVERIVDAHGWTVSVGGGADAGTGTGEGGGKDKSTDGQTRVEISCASTADDGTLEGPHLDRTHSSIELEYRSE